MLNLRVCKLNLIKGTCILVMAEVQSLVAKVRDFRPYKLPWFDELHNDHVETLLALGNIVSNREQSLPTDRLWPHLGSIPAPSLAFDLELTGHELNHSSISTDYIFT
jgi:hypothetical protein